MTDQRIDAAWLLHDPDAPALAGRGIVVVDGRISAIEQGTGGDLVMPALANAHDHARVARASQVGSSDVPLEAWLPYLALIPSVDPWLASAVAFGRTARGGVGSVMAHYTRLQGLTDFPAEARAVAKAARDVGVNMALAVQCRDINPLVYGPHEALLAGLSASACDCVTRRFLRKPLPPAEQVALVEAVARDIEGPGVTVQYGPAAVQWCSQDLLRRIAEASAGNGRRVHMHLLESRNQRMWADKMFPRGIVRHLDELGLVNERVSFAHCTWARPEDLDLIAERGATIVVNSSSNLVIRSGVAPLADMVRCGCRVAMGLDGLAADEDEDAVKEMRLGYLLHKGFGFESGLSQADLLRFATSHGRFAVTGEPPHAGLAPGGPADLLVLDWVALSAELIEPDVPPFDVLLARGRRDHVKQVYVGGREIVRDGMPTGIDLPGLEAELLARLRAGRDSTADLRAAMPELRAAIRAHYSEPFYCG